MAFPKAAPRVKGPYSERGGTRFRIRICNAQGHRDLYFPSLKQALEGMKQAEEELQPGQACRTLRAVLDEYIQEKVLRGFCRQESADEQRARLSGWLAEYLDHDIGKLMPKRAAALYEQLVVTPTRKTGAPPHSGDSSLLPETGADLVWLGRAKKVYTGEPLCTGAASRAAQPRQETATL